MKSNIFKSLFLLILMTMAFVGCSEHDGVVYSGDSTVYAFAGATQKVEMLTTDGNKIVVPVYRGTTQGTSTLELTFTPAEGIEELFTLENPTLTFEVCCRSSYYLRRYQFIGSDRPICFNFRI